MINSNLQYAAVEIANFCGEPKKVGFYIAILKRIGIERGFEIMSAMKHDDTIKSRPKIFIFRSKRQ
jgi:hypothetical protein